MKTTAAILLAIVLFGSALPAYADSCGNIAQQMATERGAEVIKVVVRSDNGATICKITLRIPGPSGQPPRVDTFEVNG